MLAVGADGIVGICFLSSSFLFSFSLFLGDSPIQTEILSLGFKSKPTIQTNLDNLTDLPGQVMECLGINGK